MDIADLVEGATDDGYHPKFEGWDYKNIRHRSAQQVCCRVAFVSSDRRTRLHATYEFFPFLENKAVVVSPHDKENPARLTIDPILALAGYTVVEHADKRAA